MEKAYKILAFKEKISNREAKAMLDNGLVSANGKKVRASDIISPKTPLRILQVESPEIIFEDSNILAINKPAFMESNALEKKYKGWNLLHRLDKHTSGVILLIQKDSEFHKNAIQEFKNECVYKEYLALVQGIVAQDTIIDKPIVTTKGNMARSKIDLKFGKRAITHISPLKIIGKKTLLKVIIKTGRTHQIRLHLHSINHAILGDNIYGKIHYKRLMLHAHKIALLGYDFCATKGDFWKYLQD